MADSGKAVFLSYASQDADAARRICDSLRGVGIEVWFDQSELRGGDAWDAKIRAQIASCALFVPIISANTQTRLEGYFRLEWKLAAQRTHTMADEKTFLMPVVVDTARDVEAKVPAEFKVVQWTRLPAGESSAAFCERMKALLAVENSGSENREAFAGTGGGKTISRSAQARKGRQWLIPAVAGLVLVVAFAIWQPWRRISFTPAGAAPIKADKSVAVLPFVNRSGDQEQDYFSDGLTEEIINALARERDLRVPGSASSFSFKGKTALPGEIARVLNVSQLVEGSVRKDGAKVRISVRLTRASDGYSEELGTFTEELRDIFALQDKVARAVVEKITRRAATNTVVVATRNSAAYDTYLRARATDMKGRSDRTVAEIIRLYEEASRLDPGFALPSAQLAQIYAEFYSGGFDRSSNSARKAREAVATALRLDPNLPEAHVAQARIQMGIDHDLEAADRELEIVERLRPGEVEVPANRAQLMSLRGQQGAGLATAVARAADADPQNATSLDYLAGYLSRAGLYADAEKLLDRALIIAPGNERFLRAKALNRFAWTGDTASSLSILEKTPEVVREKTSRFFPARALWREQQGDLPGAVADYERGRAVIKEIFKNRSGPQNVATASLYEIGRIEIKRGNAVRANECFDRAVAEAESIAREFSARGQAARMPALVLARRGQAAGALTLVADYLRHVEGIRSIPSMLETRVWKAEVLAALGRADDAIAELRSLQESGHPFGHFLRANEEFASLRGDARFQKLVANAEARAAAQPKR